MLADYHIHSRFSHDTAPGVELENIVRAALVQGLDEICITDHVELDYIGKDLPFAVEERNQALMTLQEKYQGQIQIRTGAELGLQPHLAQEYAAFMERAPLDFVIGSTHVVDRYPLKTSLYPRYAKLHSPAEGIDRYLEVTLENIKSFSDFDVYGHLDFVAQYTYDRFFSYRDHEELTDLVLQALIQSGKGIEVNSSGYPGGFCFPHPDVLRRYRELGGEIITLGSDAHVPAGVGFGLRKAQQLLADCGFRYFTVYTQRKPHFIPLG